MINGAKYATLFMLLGLQVGCSSNKEFVCSGITEGVHCISTREVYEQTNDKDALHPKKDGESTERDAVQHSGVKGTSAQMRNTPLYPSPKPGPVIPLRTPSGVMRIAVNLWQDQKKRLFSAQYVFTEIEKRKWVIGEPYLNGKAPLSPLKNGILGTRQSGQFTPLDGK